MFDCSKVNLFLTYLQKSIGIDRVLNQRLKAISMAPKKNPIGKKNPVYRPQFT